MAKRDRYPAMDIGAEQVVLRPMNCPHHSLVFGSEARYVRELDDRDPILGARVRNAQQRRVPYVAVVGRREAEAGTISVRLRTGSNYHEQPPMQR